MKTKVADADSKWLTQGGWSWLRGSRLADAAEAGLSAMQAG